MVSSKQAAGEQDGGMVTAALVTPEVTPQAALLNGKVVAKNGQAVASANNKRHQRSHQGHIAEKCCGHGLRLTRT